MEMKKTLAVLVGSFFLVSCGGGSMNNSPSSSPTLTGAWQFTATSTAFGLVVTGDGTLQQSGTSVTGEVTLSGTPCATDAALSGSVSGTAVTFQLQENGQPVNFTGTTNAGFNSMSGSYTAPSGGCTNGDFGTWSANLTN
jgi:hypothetical protein